MYRNEEMHNQDIQTNQSRRWGRDGGGGGGRTVAALVSAKKTKIKKREIVSPQTHGNATPGHHLTVRGKTRTHTRTGCHHTHARSVSLSHTHTHSLAHKH